MDRLESIVRDVFNEHADRVPVPSQVGIARRSNERSPSRWLAAAAAVGAVIGIAAVAAVATLGRSGTHREPAQHGPLQAPPAPAGLKAVSYHGIEILIPDRLPVNSFICGPPQRSVVIAQTPLAHSCTLIPVPAPAVPTGLTIVTIKPDLGAVDEASGLSPARSIQIGAMSGTRRDGESAGLPGETAIVQLPDPGVIVSVTTPTAAQTQDIISTLRAAPTDRNGCAAHVDSLRPSGNPSSNKLVPGNPTGAAVCSYSTTPGEPRTDKWLVGSSALTPQAARQLATQINSLPTTTPPRHPGGQEAHAWIVFSYADGARHTIDVITNEIPQVFTDGERTVVGPTDRTLPIGDQ
jgi:hypothetical protein